MPVKFKMLPKKNTLVSPPEVKYYPCAIHKGEEDLRAFMVKVDQAEAEHTRVAEIASFMVVLLM